MDNNRKKIEMAIDLLLEQGRITARQAQIARVEIPEKDRCPECKGTGIDTDLDPKDQTCLLCEGTGKKVEKTFTLTATIQYRVEVEVEAFGYDDARSRLTDMDCEEVIGNAHGYGEWYEIEDVEYPEYPDAR